MKYLRSYNPLVYRHCPICRTTDLFSPRPGYILCRDCHATVPTDDRAIVHASWHRGARA